MKCVFDRRVNVSSVNGFNATEVVDGIVDGSGFTKFTASLSLFDSDSFLKPALTPLTVTSFEPIFIGIKEENADERFKFVVHRCYATPTADAQDAIRYMFFDMRYVINFY